MKRAASILALVALAGCASDKGRRAEPQAAPDTNGNVDTNGGPHTIKPIAGSPYDRGSEGKDAPVTPEPEREIDLPGSVEIAMRPVGLPSMPRIAVAFVRGGKLVRRADALRKLSHAFEREARLEAIERLADDAPSRVSLDVLVARAEKQGVRLLLIDVRKTDEDPEKTTYVLTAKAPWQALAFTQPNATEPAGQELVARLVRSSRGNP